MNLKQKLSKKLKKTGGFTLIEMLIVVAIIAILVAVSIPLVSNSLEKARKATDAANERAAKAAALADYMLKGKTEKVTYNYHADDGSVEVGGTAPTGYGQCSVHKGDYITVTIDSDGTVNVEWSKKGTLDSSTIITPDDSSSSASADS